MANLTDYDREWLAKNAIPDEFYQMGKKLGAYGQKVHQRDDNEDRAMPYRNWLWDQQLTTGFCMDIDYLKFRRVNGKLEPVMITELTRCDSESVSPKYLEAVIERYTVRDRQGEVVRVLSAILDVPAYLVLFQKDIKWLWVYSFQRNEWREFTPDEWRDYLDQI